eukprot:CAMPEP_0119108550 /NCGR_PEP_ID=MMETSP1180-20130426/15055_1 /TAXON_ID=3052 ORGANISM="Chlamydomonas cf sp, Strain CCMP681" /NCGR_SAMPLE_ID=MMETSP1180 /ASSEMBLY_ACC=CAM_ASM_000741 /LENGTH=236 /DNA_ID=CAMNT_0007094175 /DNA_START=123 /DNA_END=830 /DNA_ORIENTATION=+
MCSSQREEEEMLEDTPGVEALLSRDRRDSKLQPELRESLEGTETSGPSVRPPKTRQQRREWFRKVQALPAVEQRTTDLGPKKSKQAIDAGLALFAVKDYQAAIQMFNLALELPGNGAYRLTGSPREYSCPSDAEENAALYNLACVYAQLGQAPASLTCLEAVLENGFSEWQTMRTDSDLQPLGQALQDVVSRYDSPLARASKGFMASSLVAPLMEQITGRKELISTPEGRKPWFLW